MKIGWKFTFLFVLIYDKIIIHYVSVLTMHKVLLQSHSLFFLDLCIEFRLVQLISICMAHLIAVFFLMLVLNVAICYSPFCISFNRIVGFKQCNML